MVSLVSGNWLILGVLVSFFKMSMFPSYSPGDPLQPPLHLVCGCVVSVSPGELLEVQGT